MLTIATSQYRIMKPFCFKKTLIDHFNVETMHFNFICLNDKIFYVLYIFNISTLMFDPAQHCYIEVLGTDIVPCSAKKKPKCEAR